MNELTPMQKLGALVRKGRKLKHGTNIKLLAMQAKVSVAALRGLESGNISVTIHREEPGPTWMTLAELCRVGDLLGLERKTVVRYAVAGVKETSGCEVSVRDSRRNRPQSFVDGQAPLRQMGAC